jgi:polysaccharide biosynthesis transport protein
MELQQYVAIVWKRWWLILLTTVLAAVAAAVVSFTATPVYRSTATLMVEGRSDPYEEAYRAAFNNEASAAAYARQVTGPAIAEAVVARLGLSLAPEDVQELIAADHLPDTAMFEISVQHPDPGLAYTLADTTVEVFIERTTTQVTQRYQDALDELESQIAALQAEITEDRIAWSSYGEPSTLTAAARAEQARLQTEITNNQTRLTSLLNSTEQFRLAMARASGGLSVFQPARLPRAPFSPQPARNIALATVVGGMIGVGTAFLLDYLDDTVHAPEDARQALGVAVLGAVPSVTEDPSCGWLAEKEPLSAAAEAFRDLRTSLQYASLDAPLSTILVTSTEPDEGKSFVASNLATAVAVTGKRVLLLEADLRRSQVHHIWKVERSPGLSEALRAFSEAEAAAGSPTSSGRSVTAHQAVRACIQATAIDRLALMTAGAKIATPAELLNSQTFQEVLAELRADFDLIILDSPPILTVTDAAVLAGKVDGVLMVMASGQTRLPMAARTLARVEEVGGNLLGIVINRLTARTGGYYYRHYQHGYGYGAPAPKHRRHATEIDETTEEAAALTPATHTVQQGTLTEEVAVSGRLVAAKEATLAFPVGGTVKAVYVAAGERVATGTLLAELDAPELEDQVLRTATELTVAEFELGRAEAEAQPRAAGVPSVDVAIARERLKLAEALHRRAEARLAALRLTAPFDGTVLRFDKQPGDAVTPYAAVGLLADTRRLRVRVPRPAAVGPAARPGDAVDVRLNGQQDLWLHGIVAQPEGDDPKHNQFVTVDIAPFPEAIAWLHEDAEVVLRTETRTDVPWVPLRALIPSGDKSYVDVQVDTSDDGGAPNLRTKRVRVELGMVTDYRAEVLSGVEVGDTIVYPVLN